MREVIRDYGRVTVMKVPGRGNRAHIDTTYTVLLDGKPAPEGFGQPHNNTDSAVTSARSLAHGIQIGTREAEVRLYGRIRSAFDSIMESA